MILHVTILILPSDDFHQPLLKLHILQAGEVYEPPIKEKILGELKVSEDVAALSLLDGGAVDIHPESVQDELNRLLSSSSSHVRGEKAEGGAALIHALNDLHMVVHLGVA